MGRQPARMLTPEEICPVPTKVQRRAWEAGFDLEQNQRARLSRAERVRVRRLARSGSEKITWADAGWLLRLHGAVVGRRAA